MSRVVRRAPTQALTGEAWQSHDGQGAPTYASGVAFAAQVHEMTEFTQTGDGTELVLTLGLWVSPAADFIPDEKDRITYSGDTYIVYNRRTVRSIHSAEITHYKLVCRDE